MSKAVGEGPFDFGSLLYQKIAYQSFVSEATEFEKKLPQDNIFAIPRSRRMPRNQKPTTLD